MRSKNRLQSLGPVAWSLMGNDHARRSVIPAAPVSKPRAPIDPAMLAALARMKGKR